MPNDQAQDPKGEPARRKASVPPQRQRKTADELAMAKIIHRHTLLMAIVDRLGKVFMVAAFAIPIWFMQPMVSALAGKTANINAVLIASLIINIALAIANMIQYSRRKSQGGEIRRQRDRTDILESLVGTNRSQAVLGGEK